MSGRRIFKDQRKFDEMIQMIEDGVSYSKIAKHFDCDHSSIINWARKIGVTPSNRKARESYRPRKVPPNKPYTVLKDEVNGEKINPGKMSYQEYLEEDERRRWRDFIKKTTSLNVGDTKQENLDP